MTDIPLTYAKDHLEDLIERARRGEVVTIEAGDGSTYRVVPEKLTGRPKRVPGQWKGLIQVPSRVVEPLTEDERRWLSGEDAARGSSSTRVSCSGG